MFTFLKRNKLSLYPREEGKYSHDTIYADDNQVVFSLEFGSCDGNEGKYIGTTKEIRQALDNHVWDMSAYWNRKCGYKKEWELQHIATNLSILKYGYMWEHKEIFQEINYSVDNALCITIKRL